MHNWKIILVNPDDSLEHVIKVIHKGGCRIALVTDKANKLLGTVTDGDIRRALIGQMTMDVKVSLLMNKNPTKLNNGFSSRELLSIMTKKNLMHIPIVDSNNNLLGLETLQHLIEDPVHDNPVFIMAGGFGKRLYPLTKDIPKPLLKVGDKPILETIINRFIKYGFHNFYISTHFKSELIKDYFKNGDEYGVSIQYVYEESPLGTAGSLGLLPDTPNNLPIIVMNGDILTKVDFEDLLDFHSNNDADATMCVREYDFQVPYGVVNIDNHVVKKIKEKPTHRFFVNAGIYVLNKNLVSKLDGKSYMDMTSFLSTMLDSLGVSAFPVHEYWLDIGQIHEYKRANNDIDTVFN
jgi:dTDP-glucose pyrophosphorylase